MASRAEARKRWGEVLNQWRASGQSMAAFCRQHRVDYRRLQRWGKRLEAARGRRPLTLIPVVARTSKRAAPGVPVQLSSSAGALALTIRLPGEIAIEVAAGFDPGVLVEVVALLRKRAIC